MKKTFLLIVLNSILTLIAGIISFATFSHYQNDRNENKKPHYKKKNQITLVEKSKKNEIDDNSDIKFFKKKK